MYKRNLSVVIITVGICLLSLIIFLNIIYNNPKNFLEREIISENDDGRTFEVPSLPEGFGDEYTEWATLQVNPTYSFGLRFTNITIPRGSKIIEAYVKLFSIGSKGHCHVNCTIYCDNTSDALNFSTKGCLERCGRNYTKASVDWNEKLPYLSWVKTPSIKYLVQEVINRADWKAGNALAILFITKHSDDSAVFDNYGGGHPARLYIEWR